MRRENCLGEDALRNAPLQENGSVQTFSLSFFKSFSVVGVLFNVNGEFLGGKRTTHYHWEKKENRLPRVGKTALLFSAQMKKRILSTILGMS